jgi:hypothetical protein
MLPLNHALYKVKHWMTHLFQPYFAYSGMSPKCDQDH